MLRRRLKIYGSRQNSSAVQSRADPAAAGQAATWDGAIMWAGRSGAAVLKKIHKAPKKCRKKMLGRP
jgi:hypothetical protein